MYIRLIQCSDISHGEIPFKIEITFCILLPFSRFVFYYHFQLSYPYNQDQIMKKKKNVQELWVNAFVKELCQFTNLV